MSEVESTRQQWLMGPRLHAIVAVDDRRATQIAEQFIAAHGCHGDDEILEAAQLFNDHDIHDEAGNEAADIADNCQKEHKPRNGRFALECRGAGGLRRCPPIFGREELHRPRDRFFARKRVIRRCFQ